jgi:hypothetical protein
MGHEHRIDHVSVVSGVRLIASEFVRCTTEQKAKAHSRKSSPQKSSPLSEVRELE